MRPWVKAHADLLNDYRFDKLSSDAEQVYNRMYRLAGLLDADGLFIKNGKKLSNEEIAHIIRLPMQQLAKSIKELEKRQIFHVNGKGPQIVDWKTEQPDKDREREQTKERVARYRERVTHGNALQGDVTHLEQQQESVVVVVVDRVSAVWKELIGDDNLAIRKAISKLASSGVSEQVLIQAVEITSDQGKDTAAYFKGVVANLVNGTQKPIKRGVQHRAPAKTKLGGRAIKL